MPKAKKRRRSILAPILALLLVLALAGTLLFSAFRDKIEHWEYPQRFTEYVEYYAGKYGIDPMILYAFIRTESNFDPNADSDAGARGLMQITEVTFDWIKMKIAPKESLTFDDLYDPETNIRFGSYFVSYCLDRYSGHLATAAAASALTLSVSACANAVALSSSAFSASCLACSFALTFSCSASSSCTSIINALATLIPYSPFSLDIQ